jgi:dimethylargininase
MRMALTRAVPRSLVDCELTHLQRQPIDVRTAVRQHDSYEATLLDMGLVVERQPALDDLPDSVFVEDTALVLDEIAVITRMGVTSRRPESPHTTRILANYRRLAFINAPGTLEGGDIVVIGKRIFVGISTRTNQQGIDQLRTLLKPFGYTVESVAVRGALHLKSACTAVAPDTVIANPDWVEPAAFGVERVLTVPAAEPWGANVLASAGELLVSANFPATRDLLESAGFHTYSVNVSELHKAECGVTCMSILFTV